MSPAAEHYTVGYLGRFSKTCTPRWGRYSTEFRRNVYSQSLAIVPGAGVCVAGHTMTGSGADLEGLVQMHRR